MNTIFIGGSRHISRLPTDVRDRLENVVESGHRVIVGDANGADKAVQKYLLEKHYDNVTVYCSGSTPRNNLGKWRTRSVDAPKSAKGFHFYAAKDRDMAREADFGLMIWDGKSPGTVLNVMRLALAGKISVLVNVAERKVTNIKSLDAWNSFISNCGKELQKDVKERATIEEWRQISPDIQPSFLSAFDGDAVNSGSKVAGNVTDLVPELTSHKETLKILNEALTNADATTFVNALGTIARERGMSQIARETGFARESLYRSLDISGNPEFATVLKVLSSVGLRLKANFGYSATKSKRISSKEKLA